ncbi:hypothetical protein HZB90_03270 [archaeon]|nr:hypothetical protein [archaeon]
MEFGKRLFIGALALLVGAGVGEYFLYKRFERSPDPIREVLRFPYNSDYAEYDGLVDEYRRLSSAKPEYLAEGDNLESWLRDISRHEERLQEAVGRNKVIPWMEIDALAPRCILQYVGQGEVCGACNVHE